MKLSVALHERGLAATLDAISLAESLGVPAVWHTSAVGDPLVLYAAAASRTPRIELGTAVVPLFPRHPILLAQQALQLDELAPGRLLLGVGPSHRPQTEDWHGIPYSRPLGHLREVVAILRQAFGQGEVDFEGEFYRAHFPHARTCSVPILTSALGLGAFKLAGEIADGALAWVCPPQYLAGPARQALDRGGRPVRLYGHVFVGPSRDALHARLETYRQLPNYQRMFALAGVDLADIVDHVAVWGTPSQLREKVRDWAARSGADEVICSLLPGPDGELAELLGVLV